MRQLSAWAERRRWRLIVALVIALIGALLFALLFGVEGRLADFLRSLGFALMIATIVAVTIDLLFQEELLKLVEGRLETMHIAATTAAQESLKHLEHIGQGVEETHGEIEAKLAQLPIINQAADAGIINIFRSRNTNEAQEALGKAINEELAKADGRIWLMCVAAPNFFANIGPLRDQIMEQILRGSCHVRVLLLGPTSRWGPKWGELENPPGASPRPTPDYINASIDFLTTVRNNLGDAKDRVEFHGYDTAPSVFMLLTSSCLFLEPYPLRLREDFKLATGEFSTLGRRTALIQFSSTAQAYRTWEQHFRYWWAESGGSGLPPLV